MASPVPSASPAYRSTSARRVHRSPGALLVAAAPFALALLTVFTALAMGEGATQFLAFLALPMGALGVAGFGATYSKRAYVDLKGDVVSVENGGLAVDGVVVVERGDIEQAFLLPHEGAVWVEIERRTGSPVTIRVDDDADGRALLSALGFDATQATASFRALPGLFALPQVKQAALVLAPIFALLIPSVIVFSGWQHPAAPYAILPFLLGLAFFLLLFRASSVRIGVDGLRHAWLGNERFYPWHEVLAVEHWAAPHDMKPYVGLKLVLKDGSESTILAGQEGWNADAADQLIVRAQQAWAAHRAVGDSEHLPVLSRGVRDGVAWVNHLRAIGARGASHQREAFVAPEALIRVVEDASQPAVARASALVALRSQLSNDEVDRVRIVANTTVDDPLRVAIDRALDPDTDEHALAEALLALESPEGQKA